jgi:hypothetical protein
MFHQRKVPPDHQGLRECRVLQELRAIPAHRVPQECRAILELRVPPEFRAILDHRVPLEYRVMKALKELPAKPAAIQ